MRLYSLPLLALAVACSSSPPDLVVAPTRQSAPAASSSANTPVNQIKRALAYPDNHADPNSADVLHGTKVPDPYRWLEDEKAPDVVGWLDAQDKLARAELEKMGEREELKKRLKELVYIDALFAPTKKKNRYFYSRRHADKEKAIVYFKDGKEGKERVLFDPNGWSTDGSVSLGTWSASHDGKKVAYSIKKNNSDESTLYVMDVGSMKKSEIDVIEGAKYAYPSWTATGDGFFYTWLPVDKAIAPADRPGYAEVRFHKLGADPKKDTVVRERTNDATKFVSGYATRDGRFFFLSIDHGWSGNELYFRDGGKLTDPLVALSTDAKAHYRATGYKGYLYVQTDDGAPRWRIFRVDPKKPQRDAWVEIVKESPDATLDNFEIVGGRLALTYLHKAASRLELRELDGKPFKTVDLPTIGTVGGPSGNPDDNEAYFTFESFTTPLEVHELDVKTGKTKLYSKVKVPVDPSKFDVEQVTYPSPKDKTPITMFVVRPKGAPKDGNGRMYLYGYGGFQSVESPFFWSTVYPWLERGGSFAVPNLRGGGEYGEAWHQDGMLLKKQNVFDDFVGAAEYLIQEKYTSPQRLVISGGSNGGLLVGAAMTQRPDLYAGVVCGVPLLDMVRYHKFGSGRTWISEYGSADDPAQFQALFAYSPYHHVKPGTKYPPLLLLAADSDDRVDPMHARKFAAAVQDASAGGPVLLRVERNAGHGGADLRKSEVDKSTDRLAFALWATSSK